MRFLQCQVHLTTKGRSADDLVVNARAIGKCKYDLDGRMQWSHN